MKPIDENNRAFCEIFVKSSGALVEERHVEERQRYREIAGTLPIAKLLQCLLPSCRFDLKLLLESSLSSVAQSVELRQVISVLRLEE